MWNPKNTTILIVDDTPANMDILFRYLSRYGFKILVAESGQEALHKAEQSKPDIILLDVMMPEMDGFETCFHLKGNKNTNNIPVIFMTALSEVEHKIKAFSVGAVDYVTKPVEQKEILARISTHLTIVDLQKNLQAEIAERKRVEESLRQYTIELKAQNEELDTFAHTVAHDLKNPLGIIMGMATVLASDYASMFPASLRDYLQTIAQSSQKAVNIVEELLLLASVRQKEVEAKPLDMAEVVDEALQRLSNMIIENKAEIILPDSWPSSLGYAPWIEAVWVNYISNAIKYGGQPPRIELGADEQADGMIRYWAADNGVGIPANHQELLFTTFTQLQTAPIQGHGLGLSIVRRIIDKLGGEAGVTSTGKPGEGSVFSFILPSCTTKND